MINLLIFLLIYVASVYGSYRLTQLIYYHPKGRWRSSEPEGVDVFITFMPIMNTIWVFLIFRWEKDCYRGELTFFKPNKPFAEEEIS